MENEKNHSELEDASYQEEKADDNLILENEENETSDSNLSAKESIIVEIMKTAEIREDLINMCNSLQYKLSSYIKESAEKDYFQTLDLPIDANEEMFEKSIKKIDEKEQELEKFRDLIADRLENLKTQIKEKKEELTALNSLFTTLKQKVALFSVHSEDGECYSKQEVQELLKKEEDMRKTLQYFQLEAMKKRHILNSAIKDKRNLEIKDFSTKSANIVNTLSHLSQKLHSLQNEKSAAEKKEKLLEEELNEMREALFKEKTKYTSMNAKNKELQDKCILLQHPRLLEDYKDVVAENEEAEKEIEELKNTYQSLTNIISQ